MHSDRGDIADALHIPYFGKQLFLAEHMIGILRKEGEQIELLCGKVLLLAVDPHSSCCLVDLEAADLDDVVRLLTGAYKSLIARHVRLHAGHQLAGAERLGNIIVSAKAKAADLVNIVLLS